MYPKLHCIGYCLLARACCRLHKIVRHVTFSAAGTKYHAFVFLL